MFNNFFSKKSRGKHFADNKVSSMDNSTGKAEEAIDNISEENTTELSIEDNIEMIIDDSSEVQADTPENEIPSDKVADESSKKKIDRKLIYTILLIFFACVFVFSAVMLIRAISNYKKIDDYNEDIKDKYIVVDEVPDNTEKKPSSTIVEEDSGPTPEEIKAAEDAKINAGVLEMKADYPDLIGWMILDNTDVDYSFVQSEDNEDYLYSDLDGNYLSAGTLFVDRRCNGINNQITLIHGHHMKNGAMFGTINHYSDQKTIDSNGKLSVYTGDAVRTYTVYAYMIIDAYNTTIYNLETDGEYLVRFTKNNTSIINSNIQPTGSENFILLSTCDYSYTDARSILVCVEDN